MAGTIKQRLSGSTARARVATATVVGLVAGGSSAALGHPFLAPLAVWDAAAIVWVGWVWFSIAGMSASETSSHASSEDPTRQTADVVLIVASIASLLAVGLEIYEASNATGAAKSILVALGVASVVLSWVAVHTVYTLRYAALYYGKPSGGVDFNESGYHPRYRDFAYLAFTIGMTFQVSDTELQTKEFRSTALPHALLSYMFGTVIVATTINLVAGLGK